MEDQHGGGNRVAQESYLAEVRENERPKEGRGVGPGGAPGGAEGEPLKWWTSTLQMGVRWLGLPGSMPHVYPFMYMCFREGRQGGKSTRWHV